MNFPNQRFGSIGSRLEVFNLSLTLYTTPVIYLYLSKVSRWRRRAQEPAGEAGIGQLRAAE
jgi:hypothetical protein